jgi:hypothetical protein
VTRADGAFAASGRAPAGAGIRWLGRPVQPAIADQRRTLVDIRIGVIQTPKEIEVEVADDSDRDKLMDDIDSTLARPEGVLWLTDRRGRRVGVPVARVAYVEVGVASEDRRVGFGAP